MKPRSAVKPRKKEGHLWGRRDVLTVSGWIGVGGALLAGGVAFVRFLYRRAPIEPPTVFRAGLPSDFPPGTVSDRFLKAWRVYLVRDGGRLYAIYARCTHLGCTPRWRASGKHFKCPCHGSGFTRSGVNVEGPAPRPLDRTRIWLGDDGEIRVDVAVRFAADRWDLRGASIRVGSGDQHEERGEQESR